MTLLEHDATTDRVLVSDGLALVLMSVAPLRRGPARPGAHFPEGGAALLVVEALRRHGATEDWFHHVGVGLKTLAQVMIHHHRGDFAAALHAAEKVAWSRCASSVHLLGTAMAFDDIRPGPGPHAGPSLPLPSAVSTAICQELSSESLSRVGALLEQCVSLTHRLPAATHFSEASMSYAQAVHDCLAATRTDG